MTMSMRKIRKTVGNRVRCFPGRAARVFGSCVLGAALLWGCGGGAQGLEREVSMDGKYYISNARVRLGVDLERGGSIFFFSDAQGRNLLNHADEGRFVQQSYYGRPDGSLWNGQPWAWNPIQGGGWRGEKAPILLQEDTPEGLHIVSRPVHWASGEPVAACRMEEEIALDSTIAHIRYTFYNTEAGAETHPATHQELPAVFVDADLPFMVYYAGDRPWTDDTLTRVVPGWPNEEHIRTEHWAAYTDSTGWGIGVYTPGTPVSTAYRFPGDGRTGPQGSACSYFAPVRTFAIERGMVFSYDVYLTIGTEEQIRRRFYSLYRQREAADRPDGRIP